jgi:hypothetical protein
MLTDNDLYTVAIETVLSLLFPTTTHHHQRSNVEVMGKRIK